MTLNFKSNKEKQLDRLSESIERQKPILKKIDLKMDNGVNPTEEDWREILQELGEGMDAINKMRNKKYEDLTEDEKIMYGMAALKDIDTRKR